MPATSYRFHVLADDGTLTDQAFEVFAYPMGDATIRRTPDRAVTDGTAQILWIQGASVDWSLVSGWSEMCAAEFPQSRRILVLPYLPSARGDKDTPCPARINARLCAASGITEIVTCDPHSPVWLDALTAHRADIGMHVIGLDDVVAEAVLTADYSGVIAPDHGARRRAGAVAAALGLPVWVAAKKRDPQTGRLSGYHFDTDLAAGAYLVVDDICDGGGTFALLANAVADDVTLDLWVTHGGFTGRARTDSALSRYRTVYTTDTLRRDHISSALADKMRVIALEPFVRAALSAAAPCPAER